MTTPSTQALSRPIAILILLSVGCSFASAHIAARISFDHGTGLLTAVIVRSITTLLLLSLIIWRFKHRFSFQAALNPWQLFLGLLIALQSISVYSAIARIPVGIALLGMNTFPLQLALLSWFLGGTAPSRTRGIIMVMVFAGLLLALDLPTLMAIDTAELHTWLVGIGFSLLGAFVFAVAFWVSEHKLAHTQGSTRTFYTMLTVLISSYIAGKFGLISGGLSWPSTTTALVSLFILSALYASAFIGLFMLAPRLTMAQNAPAMNIEPVASLIMGWALLGQQLSPIQIIGGAVVVSCIVAFAYTKN